ncbi:MAG: aminotransferase class V-fold PLP-dependent enzyme [bacterium]
MAYSTRVLEVIGSDLEVPLLDTTRCRYVNFDNAASTPVLKTVQDGVNRFLQWYSSIHRGAGFKSQLATWAYEEARHLLVEFLGGEGDERVVIFGKNTTEAINKLANRYPFKKDEILLSTVMEHHSNDLPWRRHVPIKKIEVDDFGRVDLEQFERALKEGGGRIPLVAVSGASNVTGIINPVYEIAQLAHEHGAELFVDAAQLAPHRKINMRRRGDLEAIDYLALSAHKMYAPYGTGALIGWPQVFEQGDPDYSGGGTVQVVTDEEVLWRTPPDKEEAGSPNVVGAVALGLSVRALQGTGMDSIAKHESILTDRLLQGLRKNQAIEVYGPPEADVDSRLGVVSLNVKDMYHAKTAAILGCEFGIGVRNGCFCAHPYIKRLLKLDARDSEKFVNNIKRGVRVNLPGMVRISFGVYNTVEEVDYVLESLRKVSEGKYRGDYVLDSTLGEYWPKGFSPSYRDYFTF